MLRTRTVFSVNTISHSLETKPKSINVIFKFNKKQNSDLIQCEAISQTRHHWPLQYKINQQRMVTKCYL